MYMSPYQKCLDNTAVSSVKVGGVINEVMSEVNYIIFVSFPVFCHKGVKVKGQLNYYCIFFLLYRIS